MICLKCGANNEYRLCSDCQTIENLDELYNEIVTFDYEIVSNKTFVQELSDEYADSISFCSVIWELLSYFNKDDVWYYYCKYFHIMHNWKDFESHAVEYLNKNADITYETEVVMLYLLRYYIDRRNSFTKQEKYCELVRQNKNLLFQLYTITATHYSQVGDFDIAEEICNYALLLSQDVNYNRVYEYDNISNDKEFWINELLNILEKNETYRKNKPYKPIKLSNRQELKEIFESKNLLYPYDVTGASSPHIYINNLLGYNYLDVNCLKTEKEKFENFCIDFINSQSDITYEVQVIMYHLLVFYITNKNSFTKQDKHCDFVRNTPNLHLQLYSEVATHYSRVGDFDIAEKICQYALELCNDESYKNFLWLNADLCRESFKEKIKKISTTNNKYRNNKPYKPNDLESKQILSEIFKSKGLVYPYDVSDVKLQDNYNFFDSKAIEYLCECFQINYNNNLSASDIETINRNIYEQLIKLDLREKDEQVLQNENIINTDTSSKLIENTYKDLNSNIKNKNIDVIYDIKKQIDSKTSNIKLSNNQELAVNTIDENLQIIACAGSGKTEIITRRIANILNSKPELTANNIVAFAFTKKSTEEMAIRIQNNLPYREDFNEMFIGTIHSFCYKLLLNNVEIFEDFKLLNEPQTYLFVSKYESSCGINTLKLSHNYETELFINCIQKMVYDYSNYDNWSDVNKKSLVEYRKCLYEHLCFDYSFLILETIKQIKSNELIQEYIKNIKYLVVDEYQDMDSLQEELIYLIYNLGANICVVGDDDQSLYKFRGCDSQNIINFSKKYDNVVKVNLDSNYRSTNDIVDFAAKSIRLNNNRLHKTMYSNNTSIENNPVIIKGFSNEFGQYKEIILNIKKLMLKNINPGNIAILVRKNKHIDLIQNELIKNSIPYVNNRMEKLFKSIEYTLFKSIFVCLKNPIIESLSFWNKYIDEPNLEKMFIYIQSIVIDGESVDFKRIFRKCIVLSNYFYKNSNECGQSKVYYDSFLDILQDFDEVYYDYSLIEKTNQVIYFIENMFDEIYKHQILLPNKNIIDALQILTVHKAKGLEFDAVFIPNMNKDEFPVQNIKANKNYYSVLKDDFELNKSQYETDIEDERNLFYVAVTRAKKYLYLYYDNSKTISPFLDEIDYM